MHNTRGLVIAGLGGGSGKSVAAMGLLAALRGRGLAVRAFKKGPDYIDAGWLARAAGSPCYNLDAWLTGPERLRTVFLRHLSGEFAAEVAVVEGNRGLYDGVDAGGSFSTAELAILLDLPVLLVINCSKATRTVAALALGCRLFEPRLRLAGLILNQVATARQERVIREALAALPPGPDGPLPVLGVMPRMKRDIFPMRHLGLTPHQEYEGADQAVADLADLAERRFDLEAILAAMRPVEMRTVEMQPVGTTAVAAKPLLVYRRADPARTRIGVLEDAAFQFYYEENLEALREEGADLVRINALTARTLPRGLHGLYIGGGFPETHARALAANAGFRSSLRTAIEAGLPVYAECGGLIYLGRSLVLEETEHRMVGVFPAAFTLSARPQAHGYSILRVEGGNAFYEAGERIRGHEFRYSVVRNWEGGPEQLALRVERGTGFREGRDGLVYKNVLALYTHILAGGTPSWARSFVRAAGRFAGIAPAAGT